MKRVYKSALTGLLIAWSAQPATAGLLQPGDVPISVACGREIQVGAAATSLTLQDTDPIVSNACPRDGIKIKNVGAGRNDRNFELDCSFLTLRGSLTGAGVELSGPNLTVRNCYVERFDEGIVAGAGSTIADSRVTDSAGDGIVLRNNASPNSGSFLAISVVGTRSRRNGGWGFRLQGNGTETDQGNFFDVKATENAKGGVLVRGNLNSIVHSDAVDNLGAGFSVSGKLNSLSEVGAERNVGPGIEIESNQCCNTNFLEIATASGNAGPGILFSSRINPATGFPVGFHSEVGSIDADANGACPQGTLANSFGSGVCLIAKGQPCRLSDLMDCGIIVVCGDNMINGSEECDGTQAPRCPGQCRPPGDPAECTCP